MTQESQYSITIEFDEFLTRFDLDAIIYNIDRIIDGDENEEPFDFDEYLYISLRGLVRPRNSYVGITAVSQGSLILTVLLSSTVSGYVSKRFFPEFRDGRLSDEIKRTAKLSDEALGFALKKINDFFEKFVRLQKARSGNLKNVKMQKIATPTQKVE